MSKIFNREVQISRDEFIHQLPDAIGNLNYEISNNEITVKDDNDKRVYINLADEGVEKLGSLDLPMKQITFRFEGYSEHEVEEFMNHYDEHTMRFGGM
jgi:hypothetical protein